MGVSDFRRNNYIRYLAYIIAVFTFIVSLIVPLIFTLTTAYASPTAALAAEISRDGRLTPPVLNRSYWQANIQVETEYPTPSLLLSIFTLVANTPRNYAMFLPIGGLARVVYFFLAKRILCAEVEDTKGYGILFSALSYAYFSFARIAVNYVGRGSLGGPLLTYFVFSYALFLRAYMTGGANTRSWLVLLSLFTLDIGYAYYVASVAIFFCTSLMIVALGVLRLRVSRSPAISITFLSLIVLIYGPFIYTIAGISGSLSLPTFLDNLALYLRTILRVDIRPQEYLLQVGVVNMNLFDRIFDLWLGAGIRLLSVLGVIYALVVYRPYKSGKSESPKLIWVFSLAILFLSPSEFGYLFVGPIPPIRYLSYFGLIVFFFILKDFFTGHSNAWIGRQLIRFLFRSDLQKKFLLVCLLVILSLGTLGGFRDAWYYSPAKPLAYQRVEPLSTFLLSHSSSKNPAILSGDADHVSIVFFITALHNRFGSVIPEPLDVDALTLYNASVTSERGRFIENMHARGIEFLLIVDDGRPIWGDEWGYAFTVPSVDSLKLSLIYNDGNSQLYTLR